MGVALELHPRFHTEMVLTLCALIMLVEREVLCANYHH